MRLDPAVDRRAARVAERHFGYLTPEQAIAVGHTTSSLRTRVANGLLERHGRLYRVSGAPNTWQGAAYCAVAGGPAGAVAAAMTAAALYGSGSPPLLPHISVPRGANHRVADCVVHRSRLGPDDVTTVGVIPVTTPARTLVDCAGLLDAPRLAELVNAMVSSGLVQLPAVEAAIDRAGLAPGRKGIPRLVAALEVWQTGLHHDSVAEARLFRLLAAWGFPPPVSLHRIYDASGRFVCEVDAAWPELRVGLEYDSGEHHHEGRWAIDERRAAAAAAAGWAIIPVDKSDLRPGGHDRLRSLLSRRLPLAG